MTKDRRGGHRGRKTAAVKTMYAPGGLFLNTPGRPADLSDNATRSPNQKMPKTVFPGPPVARKGFGPKTVAVPKGSYGWGPS